jgi:hypothetical protein
VEAFAADIRNGLHGLPMFLAISLYQAINFGRQLTH